MTRFDIPQKEQEKIQYAIENGSIDQYVSDRAASDFRTTNGTNLFKGDWSLQQHIDHIESRVMQVASDMMAPTETFYISLQYSEEKLRREVKGMGGKWDAEYKLWVVKCKRHELTGQLAYRITDKPNLCGYMGELEDYREF